MTIIHRMTILYNSLPTSNLYHNLVANIMKNINEIPDMSLEEVSELCFSSSITINRLLKKIHCPSFRTFKQEVRDVLDGYTKFNRVFPYNALSLDNISESYFCYFTQLVEDLSRQIDNAAVEDVCAMLHEAEDVHFYCEYASSHAKQQLQVDLMLMGKNVTCLSDIEAQKQDSLELTKNSVVIATSITTFSHFSEHVSLMKHVGK